MALAKNSKVKQSKSAQQSDKSSRDEGIAADNSERTAAEAAAELDFSDDDSFLEPDAVDQDEEEMFPEDFEDYYPEGFFQAAENDHLFQIQAKREDIRGRLALIYMLVTFIVFLLGFVVAVIDAYWFGTSITENLSTILPLISGIFLGSLGFVLGYYFRRAEDEERNSNRSQ